MSSRNCFNIFRMIVAALAVLDLILNIYFLISSYIAKRDGSYNRYEYEWNAFYVIRIAIAVIILFGVIRSKAVLLVISCVLNGLVFAVVLYAVAVGKFQYTNCERELCRNSGGPCDICYLRNYADYHLTTKWACKFLHKAFFGRAKIFTHFVLFFIRFSFHLSRSDRGHHFYYYVTKKANEGSLSNENNRLK